MSAVQLRWKVGSWLWLPARCWCRQAGLLTWRRPCQIQALPKPCFPPKCPYFCKTGSSQPVSMEELEKLCAEAGRHVQVDGFTGEPVGFARDYTRRLESAIGDAFREEGARPFDVHNAVVKACRRQWCCLPVATVLAASYKGRQTGRQAGIHQRTSTALPGQWLTF